jgi:tetraacyldisaccharide 4'-kinase
MAVAEARRWVGRARSSLLSADIPSDVPIWSVGSTNARGPGKTSVARGLAAELARRGHRVGVALRGYARHIPGRDTRLSTDRGHVLELGDEAMLFVGDGHLVASGPDRVDGARRLVAAGATAIVLDDGGLATELRRDLDFWVIDARFPAARGPMPMGERRLWSAVPAGASGVFVTHGDPPAGLRCPAVRVGFDFGPWHRGDREGAPEGPVAAVAGVGRFADVVAGLENPVARYRILPDHLDLDADTAARIRDWADGLPVVTTAKDYVRWPKGKRRRVYWRDRFARFDRFPW